MRTTCPSHLTILNFIIRITFGSLKKQIMKFQISRPVTYLIGLHVLLKILFSSEYVSDQLLRCPVSHLSRFLSFHITNAALPSSAVTRVLRLSEQQSCALGEQGYGSVVWKLILHK
jgi:hypothetical protein